MPYPRTLFENGARLSRSCKRLTLENIIARLIGKILNGETGHTGRDKVEGKGDGERGGDKWFEFSSIEECIGV